MRATTRDKLAMMTLKDARIVVLHIGEPTEPATLAPDESAPRTLAFHNEFIRLLPRSDADIVVGP